MKPRYVRGKAPQWPADVVSKYRRELLSVIRAMQDDVRRELRALPWPELRAIERRMLADVGVLVSDAMSLPDMASGLMGRLLDRWQSRFDEAAESIGAKMAQGALSASTRQLGRSMAEIGAPMTLQMTEATKLQLDAATQESAALIKRVPAQYIPDVQGDVMRSITSGNGLADLVPALEKRDVKVKNWAQNTARDQTRKAYSNINRVRMQEAGLDEYEWVHSGGSNKPRELHMHRFPAGLNGGIYRWDDPPVADERDGTRAHPGVLINCGCIARPVLKLEKADNNE